MAGLTSDPIEIVGRLVSASNTVLQVRRGGPDGPLAVYKPAAGERPLWDFPGAVLARHEVAAFRISEALGLGAVPATVWREDLPAGPGALQTWIDAAPGDEVGVFRPDEAPEDWLPVLRGVDEDDREVVVAHRDSERLADIAMFDIVINNSDRKAGHLLGTGAEVMGIDHGVAFHTEWKVRTVLWGFAGRPLTPGQRGALEGLLAAAAADPAVLADLSDEAAVATLERARELLAAGEFPAPRPGWPVVPWPLW